MLSDKFIYSILRLKTTFQSFDMVCQVEKPIEHVCSSILHGSLFILITVFYW